MKLKKLLLPKQAKSLLNKQGFSSIEPIIALALFSTLSSAILVTTFAAQNSVISARNRLIAMSLAEKSLHATIDLIEKDWFTSPIPNQVIDSYEINYQIQSLDDYVKNVSVEISWQENDRPKNLKLSREVVDWHSALYASQCGPLTGNWNSPQIIVGLPLEIDNPPTQVYAKEKFLYISTDSSVSSRSDFYIYDISTPQNPVFVSAINTGPGIASFAVAGNYAYLGNQSINGQLEIVDISNPFSLALMKTYKLPGNYSDGTTMANTLTYNNSKVFLGTAKSQIAELHIIDVSNPLSPNEIGSFEIGAGINALKIVNKNIFIASPANEELKILDFSNLSNIHQIGGYDAPGGSGNGKSLFLQTNTLVLGRTLGGNELSIIDISSPSSPALVSSKALNASIIGLTKADNILFLISNHVNKKFHIWDITDISNLKEIGSLNPPGAFTSLSCQHNLIFTTTTNPNQIIIIGPDL